jgi:hypothetical protein
MPVWSREELERINIVFPQGVSIFTPSEFSERYKLCGGIPRHVFTDFDDNKDAYQTAD